MKANILGLLSVAMLSLAPFQGAIAGDAVVISNKGTIISASEIRDVFFGEKQFAGDTKIIVIDNKSAQKNFLKKYLKVDLNKYNNIWTKKSFRDGLNPPALKANDADTLEYVKQTPGAVGYVSGSTSGVNVVK